VASPPAPTVRADVDGLPDLCLRVRDLVGVNLAAYLSGAETTEEFMSWLEKDDATSVYASRRLALVLDLADLFRPRNAITLLRAWLREVDPDLDRRSPAQVIRGLHGGSAAPLGEAAQRFLDDRVPRPQGVATMVRVPEPRRVLGRRSR
jgi:hypothetical protein